MLAHVRLTIGRKIYLTVALCAFGFVIVTWGQLREMSASLERQKQIELAHVGGLALGAIKEEQLAAEKAGLPVAEAQKRAAARVAAMRYGNGEYFWINDLAPRMVMHPINPALNGADLADNKDPTGKRLFVAMVETVKRDGAGYVGYQWPKPGHDKPQPKLSYVVGFAPWGWVIGTGVYIDDLQAQTWEAARQALVIVAVVLVLVIGVSVFMARGITKAMHGMTSAMRQLADGRLDVVLPGLGRRDEIGEVADAVEAFKLKAVEHAQREADDREATARAAAEEQRLADERQAREQKAAAEREDMIAKQAMNKLVEDFQATIGTVIDTVASAATELEASAGTLTKAADATQMRSNAVAAASEQASVNVQSVASATEQLSASVSEIGKQVQTSNEIARDAVKQAQETDVRVMALSQAAARIGDVVKMITAIAGQTNLLALNATIEAARAGEAGRGFAIVAQEVKALAQQTANATGEIAAQIASMQTATEESVSALKGIGETIGRISEITGAISISVEEQGAATQEIARNVDEAAKGTTEVSANITSVSQNANETGAASVQMLGSAQSLSREGNRLKTEMERFVHMIRTGAGNRRRGDDPSFAGTERRHDRRDANRLAS